MSIPYNRHPTYPSTSSLESLSSLGLSLPDLHPAADNDGDREHQAAAPLSLASIRHSLDTLHEIIPAVDTDVDMDAAPPDYAGSGPALAQSMDGGVPEIEMQDAPPSVSIMKWRQNRAAAAREAVKESPLRMSNQPVVLAPEQAHRDHASDSAGAAQTAASLLFSPTRAGAHLALYQHPPEPNFTAASHDNTSNDSTHIPRPDPGQQPPAAQQDQPVALPTPTPAWIAAMAAQLDRHHALQRAALTPYIVSSYLQLFANAAIVVFVGIAMVSAGRALRRDVLAKMAAKRAALLTAAQRCAVEYVRNECRPDARVPALDEACGVWEHCMDQALPFLGAAQGGPTQVSGLLLNGGLLEDNEGTIAYFPALAETLADIANAFFEPVTLKSLAAIVLMVTATVYAINFGFGYLRAVTFYERDSKRAGSSGVDPNGAAAIAAAYYELQQKQIKN